MAKWYILWPFGIVFPFWYVWNEKILATLATATTSSDFKPPFQMLEKRRVNYNVHQGPMLGFLKCFRQKLTFFYSKHY
jgi:hypothetical protein